MTACGAPPEGMENTVLISPLPYVPIPINPASSHRAFLFPGSPSALASLAAVLGPRCPSRGGGVSPNPRGREQPPPFPLGAARGLRAAMGAMSSASALPLISVLR